MKRYSFTTDWVSAHVPVWKSLLKDIPAVSKVLEIGAYEGRSTVWLMENAFTAAGKGEIFCIDTWAGSSEHTKIDLAAVEERFARNTAIARAKTKGRVTLHTLKGRSSDQLARLIAKGHGQSFDLVYVDGSHESPDVLSDLVLSFELCKVGGLIMCDDYLWSSATHGQQNPLDEPKLAIDAFVNCHLRKVAVYHAPLYQLYLRKTSA